MNPWRARCGEIRSAGSEGGPGKRIGRNADTAPRSDPYTKLRGPAKWTYYYLYVILDISRYVVGWMVATRESAALAEVLIRQTCAKQGIGRDQLTIHADRGSSMTSKPVAFLLADLGITQSHSRPHVSNDNPFSEAQFKTLKYRPDFPGRFASIEAARLHGQVFFGWYNDEHRHTGLGLHTPGDVHYGLAEVIRDKRATILTNAYGNLGRANAVPSGCATGPGRVHLGFRRAGNEGRSRLHGAWAECQWGLSHGHGHGACLP